MKQLLVLMSFLGCFTLPKAQTPGLSDFNANLHQGPVAPADGSGTLGWIYNNTVCGLDYVTGSVRTGLRGTINGVPQPAAISISGIPSNAVILKAYLWTGGPSNGMNVTATLTNPNSQSGNFNMTMIGQGPDICWAYPGTYHYRADVTSIISGNGNYMVSGLPTNPPNTTTDMNGATLMIIYNDPTQIWKGTIVIKDGCRTAIGVGTTDTIGNYNLCMNSLAGKAFCILSDVQMNGTNVIMNNTTATYTWDWWNCIQVNTNFMQNQTVTNFNIQSTGDCYSVVAMCHYYRHTCTPCCQPTFSASITATNNTCNNNGSATATITGGTPPYTYLWNTIPAQTTQTATGLGAGIYSCYMTDANGCLTVYDTIANAGVNASISGANPSCMGSGSATANASGGSAPYTYSWSTMPVQTTQTATNLSSGTYTVTITDAGGCTATATVTLNPPTPNGTITVTNSNCGPNGSATINPTGGTPPYTYSWNTIPIQTTQTATGLNPGPYTVTITDAFGCTATSTCVINSSPMTVSASANPSSVSCGGSTQLNVTSNHPNCTYVWSPSNTLSCSTCQNPVASPTSTTFYTVWVTSACTTMQANVMVTVGASNPVTEAVCEVTVDTSLNKNLVVWERNVPSNYSQYRIYKETSPNVFVIIGSQPITNYTTFYDLNSNPSQAPNRYKIATVDSCGVVSQMSVHHRTIHLIVTNGTGISWNLSWNGYEGFTIGNYEIYRGTNNNNMTLLTTVPNTQLTYTDLTPPLGPIQYLIVAANPSPCNPSIRPNEPEQWLAINNTLSNVVQVITAGENELDPGDLQVWSGQDGVIHVQHLSFSKQDRIEIYDLTGSLIHKTQVRDMHSEIRLPNLSKGTYFVRLVSPRGMLTRKITR